MSRSIPTVTRAKAGILTVHMGADGETPAFAGVTEVGL